MPKLPSEKLRSLASSNKAKEFKQILETELYPFLDGLPAAEQKSLLNILDNIGNEAVKLVGFDKRSNSISKNLKALLKSVRTNWKQGWEVQGEMMCELVGELCDWLPILWKVGVEMGVEHALVHKCLMFCKSTHDSLGNTNSRTEFGDIDPDDRRIEDAKGRLVYLLTYGSTEDTILWVWRELLLSSIVHCPNETVAKKIVADMKKLKLTKEILERLDDETLLGPEDGTDEDEKIDSDLRDLLQNAHWTPKMRAAVPKAKALFA